MGKSLNGKELGKGIIQRKDKKYQARFVDRFGKRNTVYGKTLKEVKNNLAYAKAENELQKNIVDKSTTLDEWYRKWMEVYKIPVVRENTKKSYEHIYTTKISPYLGKNKISSITKLQMTDLLNKLNVCTPTHIIINIGHNDFYQRSAIICDKFEKIRGVCPIIRE